MQELLDKKQFLLDALQSCDVQIILQLHGKKIHSNLWRICTVISTELYKEHPDHSIVIYETADGRRIRDVYKHIEVLGDE